MDIYNTLRIKTGKKLPRRFHCYCIGAAKTATTSVSSVFKHNFDAEHEADIEDTNHAIIDYLEGSLSEQKILEYLKSRDQRLQLEMESTHSLVYVANQLSSLFPDALFLVTIREPMAWLRSRLNFHFKKHPEEWEEYRQYFWMRKADFYPQKEQVLKENGLAPLHVYLKQYSEHYDLLFKSVPKDLQLIIRTDHLSSSFIEIADFLSIDPKKLISEQSNTEPNKAVFLDQLDEQYIKKEIWNHCSTIIKQFFPERISFYQDKTHIKT